MKDEYNLTEQELLYKLAKENNSYISKDTFRKINLLCKRLILMSVYMNLV